MQNLIDKVHDAKIKIRELNQTIMDLRQEMVIQYAPFEIGEVVKIGSTGDVPQYPGMYIPYFSYKGSECKVTQITVSEKWVSNDCWSFHIKGKIIKKDGTPGERIAEWQIPFVAPHLTTPCEYCEDGTDQHTHGTCGVCGGEGREDIPLQRCDRCQHHDNTDMDCQNHPCVNNPLYRKDFGMLAVAKNVDQFAKAVRALQYDPETKKAKRI